MLNFVKNCSKISYLIRLNFTELYFTLKTKLKFSQIFYCSYSIIKAI